MTAQAELREMAAALAATGPPPALAAAATLAADYVRGVLPDHLSDADAGYVVLAVSQIVNDLQQCGLRHALLPLLAAAAVELTKADRDAAG